MPFGRKSIVPPPCAVSVGVQLIVAVGDPTVIVSVVLVRGVRVTVPEVLPILPRNAPVGGASWARAGWAASAAAAQENISALRLRLKRREMSDAYGVIGSSMARAGS